MNESNQDQVVYLYLDDIIPNRFQPREVFDENALKELALSIKEHGVIQPIIVRSVNGKYEIIAGERRYKASALAGLTKIPAIIRNLDDKESSKVALLENLQRKNLTPIEEARTYQKILELDEMTQEELAKTMGKSQSSVANKLRLLSLPDEVQNALLKEQISERHARTLLNIPDSKKQIEMLKKIISTKMSVRLLEKEIKELYPSNEEGDASMNTQLNNNFLNVPTTDMYINKEQLSPTTNFESANNSYGEIKIVPPSDGNFSTPGINYGEIGKENHEIQRPLVEFNNIDVPNVNELRQQAIDIAPPKKKISAPTADLDGLLNLQNMAASSPMIMPNTNYQNPNNIEVKPISNNLMDENVGRDYFTSVPIIPTSINNSITGNSQIEIPSGISKENAILKIDELISILSKKGIPVTINKMDFPSSTQMIIKIDK